MLRRNKSITLHPELKKKNKNREVPLEGLDIRDALRNILSFHQETDIRLFALQPLEPSDG
jgi:hypothetical protein